MEQEEDSHHHLFNWNPRLIIVGGSHACRIADNIPSSQELEVIDLSIPRWRVTDESCARLAAERADVVQAGDEANTTVFYHLFDDSVYFSVDDEGNQELPVRSAVDGQLHIEGMLAVIDKESYKALYNVAFPVLAASGRAKKILFSPMQRYMVRPCCHDQGHMPNYLDPNYMAELSQSLIDLKQWLKDSAFVTSMKNYKVYSPDQAIEFLSRSPEELLSRGPEELQSRNADDPVSQDREEICIGKKLKVSTVWGSDPVHMSAEGYGMLAQFVVKTATDPNLKFTKADGKKKKSSSKTNIISWRGREPRGGGSGRNRRMFRGKNIPPGWRMGRGGSSSGISNFNSIEGTKNSTKSKGRKSLGNHL